MSETTVEAYRSALIRRGNWKACNGRAGTMAATDCDGCAVSADCPYLAKYRGLNDNVESTRDAVRLLFND